MTRAMSHSITGPMQGHQTAARRATLPAARRGTAIGSRHSVGPLAERAMGTTRGGSGRALRALVNGAVAGRGEPLDVGVRQAMEARFSQQFSDVRIHRDTGAAASARALRASAFTVGSDVVFGANRYAPHTPAGFQLLAHELAHVSQQRGATASGDLSLDHSSSSLERHARLAALRVATGQSAGYVGRASVQSMQREEESGSPSVLDDRLVNIAANAAMGETTWHLLRELLRGVAGGFMAGKKEGRVDKLKNKFEPLIDHPWDHRNDLLALYKGYVWGLGQGLVSPITDLWHLIKFVLETQMRVNAWLFDQGRSLLQNPELVAFKAAALAVRAHAVLEEAGNVLGKFLADPVAGVEQLKQQLERLQSGAGAAARAAGHRAATAIYDALDRPWQQLGEEVGNIIGALLAQVLLAALSEGIGNAIAAAGRLVGRMATMAVGEILGVLRQVGQLASRLLGGLKSATMGIFRELAGKAAKLVEELIEFFLTLGKGLEPAALTAAGPAEAEGSLAFAKRLEPRGPRTTLTTVEELRPQPAAPRAPPRTTVEAPRAPAAATVETPGPASPADVQTRRPPARSAAGRRMTPAQEARLRAFKAELKRTRRPIDDKELNRLLERYLDRRSSNIDDALDKLEKRIAARTSEAASDFGVVTEDFAELRDPSQGFEGRSMEDVRTSLGESVETEAIQDLSKREAKVMRTPRHHVLSQEHIQWLEREGFAEKDVHRLTVELEQGFHEGTHGGSNIKRARAWENEWNSRLLRELKEAKAAKMGQMLTSRDIWNVVSRLMRIYDIPFDFVPYKG